MLQSWQHSTLQAAQRPPSTKKSLNHRDCRGLKGSIITKTSSLNSSRCLVKGGFLPRYWHISQRPQMLHSN